MELKSELSALEPQPGEEPSQPEEYEPQEENRGDMPLCYVNFESSRETNSLFFLRALEVAEV